MCPNSQIQEEEEGSLGQSGPVKNAANVFGNEQKLETHHLKTTDAL